MNLDTNPTIEELRRLLGQCDDWAGHHVLWVKKTGDVHLSCIPVEQNPVEFEKAHTDMQLRFETFLAGNEYVGPDAAADEDWISELFQRLRKEWQQTKGRPEVAYADKL